MKKIELIFGNIEKIHTLHERLLEKLKNAISMEKKQATQIGQIFVVSIFVTTIAYDVVHMYINIL